MSKKRNDNDNYVKGLIERQDQQYNPGYYTGGKIPHYISNPGNPKLLGNLYLIASFVFVLFAISVISIFQISSNIEKILSFITLGSFALLFLLLGLKYRSQGKKLIQLKKEK